VGGCGVLVQRMQQSSVQLGLQQQAKLDRVNKRAASLEKRLRTSQVCFDAFGSSVLRSCSQQLLVVGEPCSSSWSNVTPQQ
jgi:hypothetical protein